MQTNWNKVILVNENDQEIGTKDKLQAHLDGNLHRAFSIFIFNEQGQLLLQKRALEKYHSPGLWTNTCCSHPQPGITIDLSLKERLMEEMGMEASLEYQFGFKYKSEYDNGLTEHEYDHVYFGYSNELPKPNPVEVCEYRYIDIEDLKKDLKTNPEQYTSWLKIIFDQKENFFM